MVTVCHLTSAHESNDTRIFYKECSSLAAGGYAVYLVARGESREENGVHVIGVGAAPDSRLKRMTTFAKRVYRAALKLDCDIYHFHDPELLPYGLKLKKRGKTVVFDSHENTLEQMDEKAWIPKPFRKAVSKAYRAYAVREFGRLDALISVTPHIVEQLKAVNPNTCMITNYPIFAEAPEAEKQPGTLALCFAGGIAPQWSHETVIRALEALPDTEYRLCGPVSAAYLDRLQALPGWRSVHFYGKVPFETSVAIQRTSHIGVALLQPSKNTGGRRGTIGNTKIFEYMMTGLPLICTDFDLWKEITEQWHCGICVDPNDGAAFAAAVGFLRDHPEEARRMGENGRRAVKEVFNWDTQEKELLRLYRELTNGT